jgi:hypothetical protein
MDIIFKVPETENCLDPDCLHHQEPPAVLEDELHGLMDRGYEANPFDSFVFGLLLTCHMRVVDVLDHLLMHATSCAKATLASPNIKEPQLHIPELRVGNFIVSPTSSSSMQAVLLIHIASVLVDRSKQLSERVDEALKDKTSTKQTSIFKLQCEILVETGESTVLALHKLLDGLVKVGCMR